jgi:hypothetical protein
MALGAELEGDARGWSSRSALGGRAQGWQHVGAELGASDARGQARGWCAWAELGGSMLEGGVQGNTIWGTEI